MNYGKGCWAEFKEGVFLRGVLSIFDMRIIAKRHALSWSVRDSAGRVRFGSGVESGMISNFVHDKLLGNSHSNCA